MFICQEILFRLIYKFLFLFSKGWGSHSKRIKFEEFLFSNNPFNQQADSYKKQKTLNFLRVFDCCEGRVRTSDLRVMSPTSYRCSTSRFRVANVGR